MPNNTETSEKKKDNTKSMKRMAWLILITFLIICVVSVVGVVLINIFNVPISKLNGFDKKINSVDEKVDLVRFKVELIDTNLDVDSEKTDIIDENIRIVESKINEIDSKIEEINLSDDLKSGSDVDKGIESTLLATGLAIIGIAIAVWAGLNIINAVTKDDLYETKQKLEEMKEKYKNIYEETQRTTIAHYKALFLQELFKTEKDVCSRYFYSSFSSPLQLKEQDIANDLGLWSLLYQIEQKFVEVYNLHQSIYAEDSVLVKKANTGLSLIEELKHKKSIDTNDLFTEVVGDFASENPDNIIKQFLHFRKAEFNFYKGYVKTNNIETAENFLSSAKTYFSFAKIFGCFINLNDIEDISEDIPVYKGEQPEIAAYLANSIGESYSKMLHLLPKTFDTFKTSHGNIEQSFLEGYAKQAIFYCECAVKWAPKARETYNRNLGCAYERAERLKNKVGLKKKEILSNYKTSLSLMIKEKTSSIITQNNVYHVVLSYYERIIRESFKQHSENIFDFELEKVVEIVKKSTDDKSELVKDLLDYVAIAEMGVLQNCHHTLRTALLGMAYTYVLILLKADISLAKLSFKDVDYYMKRIYEIISMLKLDFDVKDDDDEETKSKKFDDYSYEVLLRYNGLKSI